MPRPNEQPQPEPAPSPRERAKAWLRSLGDGDHNRGQIIGLAREILIPSEQVDTVRYVIVTEGVKRLLGETRRFRRQRQGMRPFEEISRDGEQLELPFVELRFCEARQVIERKLSAIRGATIRAEFEESIYKLAVARCKERDQDPDNIELVIGDFIDEEEIDERWKDWLAEEGEG
jgi:hypothetical protein